jgi:hypothetical protein
MRMTRSSRTLLTALATACAVAVLGLPSAAADTPVGTAVSPVGLPSATSQQLVPLAGEPGRLVYGQAQTLGDGQTGVDVSGDAELEEYDGSGSPVDLGPAPMIYAGYSEQFSLVGPMLTASADPYGTSSVLWWNLGNQTSGTATSPGTWLGSAADGYYYFTGDSVYDETTGGASTIVGSPFSEAGETIFGGSVGPDGLVLAGNHGDLAYLTFGGTVTPLQSAWKSYEAQDQYNGVTCGATSDTDTVCTIFLDGGDSDSGALAQLVPLDGSAPVAVSDTCMGPGGRQPSAALTSGALICADDVVTSQNLTPSGTASVSNYAVGQPFGYGGTEVVAALGTAVVANPNRTELETVTASTSVPVALLAAPMSVVTAGDFALSSGRIAWTSDQTVPGRPSSTVSSVRTATISNSAGTLNVGASTVFARTAGWRYLYASDETTAYSKLTVTNGLKIASLRVVSPQRSTVVSDANRKDVWVSGNQVMYLAAETARHPKKRYMLLNATTGKIAPITALNKALAANIDLSPSGLAGKYVAYVTSTGVVKRLNVDTGKVKTVAHGADPHFQDSVHVYGPYVGWMSNGAATDGVGPGRFRNATTMSAPIKLSPGTFIVATTNSGIVTEHEGSTQTVDYSLRGYGSDNTETVILSELHAQRPAQVDDSIVAWIDADSVVRAAPIPNNTVTPLSLGAPYAPRSFTPSNHRTWRASIPFSAALSTCWIKISHAGRTVKTLSCLPADVTEGVAAAVWNGRTHSGATVSPGDYTWRATVQGTSGVTKTAGGRIDVS